MAVRRRDQRWHYDFMGRGVRHRGSIPEAGNKAQAERAEAKIKLDRFERRFGDGTSKGFTDFVREIYEPIAKLKLSYERGDKLHLPVFIA